MYSLLLAVIYLSFISLGLPDSLVGSAWPVMHTDFGVPLSYAGIITMIISFGTIISSLLSDRLTRRFGAGPVTAVSVTMTALALLGFSLSGSFAALCLWSIPYGLGAGAIDAALNNYVALHYSSRHMSWLHCFWGVGAAVSPYIMGYCLTGGYGWSSGYRAVGFIQLAIAAVVFLSLPIWAKPKKAAEGEVPPEPLGLFKAVKIPGVPQVLLAFFAYCSAEQTAMLWASSYLAQFRGIDAVTAARFGSLIFLGITAGRFLSGFVSDRLGDKAMIRIGTAVEAAGIAMVMLPSQGDFLCLSGLVIIGFGCAPIYPCIIHSTPGSFGRENSQAIIGIQMAAAYVGTTFMPPLFGLLSSALSLGALPYYLAALVLLQVVMSERLNKITADRV